MSTEPDAHFPLPDLNPGIYTLTTALEAIREEPNDEEAVYKHAIAALRLIGKGSVNLDSLVRVVLWRCSFAGSEAAVWHESKVPASEIRPIREVYYAYRGSDVLQAQGRLGDASDE
jgi:hypothetical protein